MLCPVVGVPRCIVNYIRHQFLMRYTVASQFGCHDVPRLSTTTPYKPLEEALCCSPISTSLQIDIDNFYVLIHSASQIVLYATNIHEDLIEVERIAVTTMPLLQSTSVSGAKLNSPGSDGFIADTNGAFGEQIVDRFSAVLQQRRPFESGKRTEWHGRD